MIPLPYVVVLWCRGTLSYHSFLSLLASLAVIRPFLQFRGPSSLLSVVSSCLTWLFIVCLMTWIHRINHSSGGVVVNITFIFQQHPPPSSFLSLSLSLFLSLYIIYYRSVLHERSQILLWAFFAKTQNC